MSSHEIHSDTAQRHRS